MIGTLWTKRLWVQISGEDMLNNNDFIKKHTQCNRVCQICQLKTTLLCDFLGDPNSLFLFAMHHLWKLVKYHHMWSVPNPHDFTWNKIVHVKSIFSPVMVENCRGEEKRSTASVFLEFSALRDTWLAFLCTSLYQRSGTGLTDRRERERKRKEEAENLVVIHPP